MLSPFLDEDVVFNVAVSPLLFLGDFELLGCLGESIKLDISPGTGVQLRLWLARFGLLRPGLLCSAALDPGGLDRRWALVSRRPVEPDRRGFPLLSSLSLLLCERRLGLKGERRIPSLLRVDDRLRGVTGSPPFSIPLGRRGGVTGSPLLSVPRFCSSNASFSLLPCSC
jgi:hypothetical protein